MKPHHTFRPFRHARLFTASFLFALAACGSGGQGSGSSLPPVTADGPMLDTWLTRGDRSQLLQQQTAGPRLATGAALEAAVIDVDPTQRYQRMLGFGASFTDASSYVINQRMSPTQRAALLQELFGRGPEGIGFAWTRLTIGASDFSRRHYTYNDVPPGQADPQLLRFSIEPMREDVLPVLKQALAVNPELQVMASPWSAPAWMKENDSLIKGRLRADRYEVFSHYLVRYVQAMKAEGVPIFALTVQNEPHFEPPDYPGMRVDPPARAQLIGQHLGPLLAREGLKTQILDWDHNWDEPQSPLAVLDDPAAREHVSGVAWHCYVSETLLPNQSKVRDAHPTKDVWLTECSGGNWATDWNERLPWTVRNLVIGSTRHWARGVQMWNLALDERHGPHLGGCRDCRGIVTINSQSGEVTRNIEYYAFAHASKFVRPGAERIASSGGTTGQLDHVAFRNADDGSLVLVVCNSTAREQRFSLRVQGRSASLALAPNSVATYIWR